MAYQHIQVEPIAGALGAEVGGVDLSQGLDPATMKEIHDAWLEHQVLFFRDQAVSRDRHKEFGRNFGDLHVHPVLQPLKEQGHPEIVVLESGGERGKFVASSWHSDVTFQHKPPLGSILRCLAAPPAGGDTMWASMYAAYEGLSDSMQNLLAELRAVHTSGFFTQIAKGDQKQDLDADDRAVHPVIRTHPETGRKAIFVNSVFTRSIEGMKPKESEALLGFLYEHLAQPEFSCRFRWRENSIAMWDNRCTQHRVLADNLEDPRRMERVTIVGDAPF